MFDEALISAARVSKAWPFQEAMKLVKRYPDGKPGGARSLHCLFDDGSVGQKVHREHDGLHAVEQKLDEAALQSGGEAPIHHLVITDRGRPFHKNPWTVREDAVRRLGGESGCSDGVQRPGEDTYLAETTLDGGLREISGFRGMPTNDGVSPHHDNQALFSEHSVPLALSRPPARSAG